MFIFILQCFKKFNDIQVWLGGGCQTTAQGRRSEVKTPCTSVRLTHFIFNYQYSFLISSCFLFPLSHWSPQQLSRVGTGVCGGTTVHYRVKETRLLRVVCRRTWLLAAARREGEVPVALAAPPLIVITSVLIT